MTERSDKVLVTADWQLCNRLPHSRPVDNGETDRFQDQKEVVKEIVAIAGREQVNRVLILGDLFERRLLDAITLKFCVDALTKLSMVAPVYIMPGNHDAHSMQGRRFTPEFLDSLGGAAIRYLGEGSFSQTKWARFAALPWCPTDGAMEKIRALRQYIEQNPGDGKQVLLLHHPIVGCRTSENYVCPEQDGLDPDEVCEGWDMVIAGHFHDYQEFGGCGFYVGAPMQHDFRDANREEQRGVRVLEFSDSGVKRRFHPISSPMFYTRKWSELRGTKSVLHLSDGDFLRVGIECQAADWPRLYATAKDLFHESEQAGSRIFIHHIPIVEVNQRLAVEEGRSTTKTLEDYVELNDPGPLDRTRLLEIGKALLAEVENG